MSSQTFEFGDFVLDIANKRLTRDGTPISITPKAFDVLQVLVKKQGNLVQKSELVETVWPDTFVEEGNLKFTVTLLRRALGDDSHDPRYIETVPRRGYRFIAPVRVSSAVNGRQLAPILEQREVVRGASRRPGRRVFTAVGIVTVIAIAVTGLFFSFGNRRDQTARLLTTPFTVERLTTDGNVRAAAISSDGGSLAYLVERGNKQGVWLRRIEDNTNVEIVPLGEDVYGGLALAPDGNTLYFARTPQTSSTSFSIFKVPISGGIPSPVVTETQGWMSISGDGKKISFVRCLLRDNDNCSLYLANAADGSDEIKLVTRPKPFRIGDNHISPDSTTVAFAAGQSENAADQFGLYTVSIDGQNEKEISSRKFYNVKGLLWMPDGHSILMTARTTGDVGIGIWQASSEGGEPVKLTRDSENYSDISLDRSGNNLVATRVSRNFQLSILDAESGYTRRVVADAVDGSFGPDGRLYFSSIMSGNGEIWTSSKEGSDLRQVSNDPREDIVPLPAPDGTFLAFSSNSSGEHQIWRMNPDGTGRSQLSQRVGGIPLFISADSAWIYYRSSLDKSLWRVSVMGGDETEVLKNVGYFAAYSPNRSQMAYFDRNDRGNLRVVDVQDLAEVATFDISSTLGNPIGIAWADAGASILFVTSRNNANVLWKQSLSKSGAEKIADLGTKEMTSFTASPNGLLFAVVDGDWHHDAVLIKGLK